MTLHKALLSLGLVSALAGAAYAQEQAPAPGVVARGSTDVLSGGLPVARQGDATTSPGGVVTEGSSDVLINGKPAARAGPAGRKRVHAGLRRAMPAGYGGEWANSVPIRTGYALA